MEKISRQVERHGDARPISFAEWQQSIRDYRILRQLVINSAMKNHAQQRNQAALYAAGTEG